MQTRIRFFAIVGLLWVAGMGECAQEGKIPRMPVLSSESWRISEMPELGDLKGSNPQNQHIVDHSFIQASNGKWQLWACIRGTQVGRLLYGWEGDSLEHGPWKARGIVARASEEFGEKVNPELIQAPHFMKIKNVFHCFYNSSGIRLMTSEDGIHYVRKILNENNNILYKDGGRDVMVMQDGDTYYAYSTVSWVSKDDWPRSFVMVRTSKNLRRWSDYTIVCEGGRAGNGPVSAESPFVIKVDGYYYLFRSSSITGTVFVYRSDNPYYFCINNDVNLIAEFPLKAPEILFHNNHYYISDLADFQGIKLQRFGWE